LERLTIQRFYKSGSNTIIEQERKLIKRRRIKIFLSFIMYINGFVSIEKKKHETSHINGFVSIGKKKHETSLQMVNNWFIIDFFLLL
jgi:hypothetical protein